MGRESATKRRLPEAAVCAFVEKALGRPVAACEERKDGFFNTAYALTLADGGRMVLKIAPPADALVLRDEIRLMDNETTALRVAAAAGLPAPRLVRSFAADCALGCPCFLMTYLEGTSFERMQEGLDGAQVEAVYRQLGALVRTIHAHTGDAYGRLIDRFHSWRDAFAAMAENLARDARDTQALPEAVARAFLDRVRRDEAALEEVRRPALLHRDLWFGNLFIDRASLRVTGLIDWERAQHGDPLLEFVFGFIEGRSAFARGVSAFNEGYGRDGRLSEAEQARITLYTAYFQAILPVEGRMRGYGTEASARKAVGALCATLDMA